jgi:hypothetical protein
MAAMSALLSSAGEEVEALPALFYILYMLSSFRHTRGGGIVRDAAHRIHCYVLQKTAGSRVVDLIPFKPKTGLAMPN